MKIQIARDEDVPEVLELLESRGWAEGFDAARGDVYVAWDDGVIGCLQKIEIDDQSHVLDVVLVDEKRRREGIGTELVRVATNEVHDVYVSCRQDAVGFYESLGFTLLADGLDAAPPRVQEYWRGVRNRAPLVMRSQAR